MESKKPARQTADGAGSFTESIADRTGLPFGEADAVGAPASRRVLRSQGKRTMRKLLDAAMVAFDQRGYHATRVNDVVEIAKTSHGTFYLYFSNKEDLLRALVTEAATEAQHLYDTLNASPEQGGTPRLGRRAGLDQRLLGPCGFATRRCSGPGPTWPPSTPSSSTSSGRPSP